MIYACGCVMASSMRCLRMIPGAYSISTFAQTDLPIQISSSGQETTRIGHSDVPILAMSNRELYDRAHSANGRWYQMEFQKRYAYPTACLVLMLVGIPLGLSSRRGGKSMGFVLTIFLVFVYYFLSSTGMALARTTKDSCPAWRMGSQPVVRHGWHAAAVPNVARDSSFPDASGSAKKCARCFVEAGSHLREPYSMLFLGARCMRDFR